MLSDHEQRALVEIEAFIETGETGSPAPTAARSFRDLGSAGWAGSVVAGPLSAVLLMSRAAIGGAGPGEASRGRGKAR